MPEKYVLGFGSLDRAALRLVGGKGASLGELARIAGIRVPDGFCISTDAFAKVIEASVTARASLDRLANLEADDRKRITDASAELRRAIETLPIPADIQGEIARAVAQLGDEHAYAVRSSATAEDLPTASFAGQHDTFLNVIGVPAIVQHVRQCWASLFTERAVIYRLQNGFDHRQVRLAVVVQRMVLPQAAGILFTADPITANRKVATIDASFGLGEALISGRVNADIYKVRNGHIVERKISTKKLAIHARRDGGTADHAIDRELQETPALTDAQAVELERIGRTIEAHFGEPQDIEWCLADDAFHIVQSRPITTLFPIPDVGDGENHVFISVGHQQMMTDPMKPLGRSLFQLTGAGSTFVEAGGRLFVDATGRLAGPSRDDFLDMLGRSDPLIKDALLTVLDRGDFIRATAADPHAGHPIRSSRGLSAAEIAAPVEEDPTIVSTLIARSEAALATLRQDIQGKAGPELFEFILDDLQRMKKSLWDPMNLTAIMAGMHASAWINDKMSEWLDEKNAADIITQSVLGNITSDMGLALLDVADVIRPYPAVIAHLQQATTDDFLDTLPKVEGGREARAAIDAFLDKYGMRCAGEIDITKPRWSETPRTLVPLILGNIKIFAQGAGKQKFEESRQEASKKERQLLERVALLPDGETKASEAKQMIDLIRRFMGYREYPKYALVNRYFVYKQALLREGERLTSAGVFAEKHDMFYLTFQELQTVARTGQLDPGLVGKRKEQHATFEKLTPPRVITSDGEIVRGAYKRTDLPANAIAGLAVSSGIVEGRARVVLEMEDANLEEGDILVTAFTDPSWTPLFVSLRGLITEVGGLMTHGAVIAREYGLPAVVGVENATRLIEDGTRIRVNGTDGYVELL